MKCRRMLHRSVNQRSVNRRRQGWRKALKQARRPEGETLQSLGLQSRFIHGIIKAANTHK